MPPRATEWLTDTPHQLSPPASPTPRVLSRPEGRAVRDAPQPPQPVRRDASPGPCRRGPRHTPLLRRPHSADTPRGAGLGCGLPQPTTAKRAPPGPRHIRSLRRMVRRRLCRLRRRLLVRSSFLFVSLRLRRGLSRKIHPFPQTELSLCFITTYVRGVYLVKAAEAVIEGNIEVLHCVFRELISVPRLDDQFHVN